MNSDLYRDLVARLYPGAELDAVVRLTGGVSADVYRLDLRWPSGRVEPVVLRSHGSSHSGHAAELEFRLLCALFEAGLPVPRVTHVDASTQVLPDPFLLMDFAQGSTVIPIDQAPEHIDAMAEALVSIHNASIHGLPALPNRTNPLPEVFEYLPQGAEWQALRTHLGSLSDTTYQGAPMLLHGDFWPDNLLWSDGVISTILDWEDAAIGDPLCDVAGCSVELRYKFGAAGMQRFIQAYAKYRPVDLQRLALWQVYVAAAAQRYMGEWGLDAALEAHMRVEALASMREAGMVLMARPAD